MLGRMRERIAATPRERLRAVAELVPRGSRVADVGSDHGLLPVLLLESGRAARCIATERDAARLAALRGRLSSRGDPRDRLDLRAGDGLAALSENDRIDVVVVAGLGARSIVRILDTPALDALAPARLVLQPQTEPHLVRRFLVRRGFAIVDETLVRGSRRDHVVLAADPRGPAPPEPPPAGLTPDDVLEAGPVLLASGLPEVRAHWRRRAAAAKAILDGPAAGRGRRAALLALERALRILAHLRRRQYGGVY